MAEIQYNVEVSVNDQPIQGLERSLSDAADRMQELARLTAALNSEMTQSRQAGTAYAELEERQAAINAEMDRQTEVVNRNADDLERAGESGSLSIGKIATAIFTTGIGLQLAGRLVSNLERRFVRLAQVTGGTVGQEFQDFGRSLSGMLLRLQSVIGAASLATAGALALGGAIAGGTVTVIAASAAMAIAVGRVKNYAGELIALEQAAVGANESMQDIGETVRAGQRLGLDIKPGDFRQFAAARDRALQDAEGEEAQAYVRLGLAPGSGLGEVRDALLEIQDEATRTTLAITLFGRSLGARIAMMDEVTDAERNLTAQRLADAEKVKAASAVWNQIAQRWTDAGNSITADLAPSVERFGEVLLPILDDIALWLRYSPGIERTFEVVEDVLTLLAEGGRWLLGVSAEQQAAWRAQSQREAAQQRVRDEIATAQVRQDRLALDASLEQSKAASASAQSATAFQAAVESTDDTLRMILPRIECGAESAAAVVEAQREGGDDGAGSRSPIDRLSGPAAMSALAFAAGMDPATVEPPEARAAREAALRQEEATGRLGARWQTLVDVVNPFGAQPPSPGQAWRAVTGGPDRPNLIDATMQAIPGPSVAEGARYVTDQAGRALDFRPAQYLPAWGGGGRENPGPSMGEAINQGVGFDLLGVLGWQPQDGGDTAFQDAGDTVYNIDLTYNDRRGSGARPDVRGMADDLAAALDRRYAGD